uniref:Uncharacterized protein n=1 Tax=Romanomermis culicivorax TaxID=13658 RepID=A0A915IJS9_ROMCU
MGVGVKTTVADDDDGSAEPPCMVGAIVAVGLGKLIKTMDFCGNSEPRPLPSYDEIQQKIVKT